MLMGHCNNPDTKAELQAFKDRGVSLVKVNYNSETTLKRMRDSCVPSFDPVCRCPSGKGCWAPALRSYQSKYCAGKLDILTKKLYSLVCLNKDGPNVTKEKARSLLKELKLPFALFQGGLWVEYIPFILGYNFKEGVMNVVGEGDAKMSIVARSDLSRFIAHVLVEATKSSLE
ncbi:hypothetical protein PC116_g6645 [Phytophthora cactorum]|uniref:Uncharacterized protein n=1 Tax=Phytophthora cactorum TaxID=29920 RepID=A0A8T1GJI8_9STRA|nr:hypothetical protein PC113_g5012 [Phytophthora cactorum]KAG2948275.1 hypothetical protein PC117_g6146 [Phytophthora cactorum]KAG2992670.1 hypothetical protein PC118_g4439 [Phytophthora cactorum]KAG3030469.1 hypothetical protein PC119_g6256 [Phytophthora cactorum]KAG4245553.1 hypothetical protein PC116_g6645 [Phytophthora cactorum]